MKRILHRLLAGACALTLTLSGCAPARQIQVNEDGAAGVVKISAVGDIFLSQTVMDSAMKDGGYDFAPAFTGVASHLSTADLAIGNFEGTMCGAPYSAPNRNYPEALAFALADAGIDVLQTGNTYSVANGTPGLKSTISYLDAAGIQHVGTYTSPDDREDNGVLIREINGVRIAILAFTKGVDNVRLPEGAEYCVNLLYSDYDSAYSKVNSEAIDAYVAEAKALNPDVIIAMVHWGSEYSRDISDSQKSIERRLYADGVNAIIGTHSHLAGKAYEHEITDNEDHTKNVLTAYSLGNFYGDDSDSRTATSMILNMTFTKYSDGSTELTGWDYTPIYQADFGEEDARRFRVLHVQNSISLYDDHYFDRVTPELYEELQEVPERLKSRVEPTDDDD